MPRKINPKRWPDLIRADKKNQRHGWRKKHRGKEKYWGSREGENRAASYARCVILMREWKAKLDLEHYSDPYGADRRQWEGQIKRYENEIASHRQFLEEQSGRPRLLKLRPSGEKSQTELDIEFAQTQIAFCERMIAKQMPFDFELIAHSRSDRLLDRHWKRDLEPDGDPVPIEQTIQAHIDAFLATLMEAVEIEKMKPGSYDAIASQFEYVSTKW